MHYARHTAVPFWPFPINVSSGVIEEEEENLTRDPRSYREFRSMFQGRGSPNRNVKGRKGACPGAVNHSFFVVGIVLCE